MERPHNTRHVGRTGAFISLSLLLCHNFRSGRTAKVCRLSNFCPFFVRKMSSRGRRLVASPPILPFLTTLLSLLPRGASNSSVASQILAQLAPLRQFEVHLVTGGDGDLAEEAQRILNLPVATHTVNGTLSLPRRPDCQVALPRPARFVLP